MPRGSRKPRRRKRLILQRRRCTRSHRIPQPVHRAALPVHNTRHTTSMHHVHTHVARTRVHQPNPPPRTRSEPQADLRPACPHQGPTLTPPAATRRRHHRESPRPPPGGPAATPRREPPLWPLLPARPDPSKRAATRLTQTSNARRRHRQHAARGTRCRQHTRNSSPPSGASHPQRNE